MARRKDHSPQELKQLILSSAEKIIYSKGIEALTARALAKAIGYTPGTIYNFYRDMDALIIDINYATMGKLQAFCFERTKDLPKDFTRVKAFAYAYVDFVDNNLRAWQTIFAKKKERIPKYYQQRLIDIFQLIEVTLHECLGISTEEAANAARLLWVCLHGITQLTIDGRLRLIGATNPHAMIDDLLQKYLHPAR